MKAACSLRLFTMAMVVLAVVVGAVANGDEFQAAVDWIYYQDASGREMNYDFSSGTIENDRTVTIPASAVTLPAPESGATVTWERGDGLSDIWLSNDMYYMSIPQALPSIVDIPTADITVDGSISDWSGVSIYADDVSGDVFSGLPTGCDIDYVKLAYSSDSSTLYVLYRLTENANQNVGYRLFMDKDLDGDTEVGDFQVDVQYYGSAWHLVAQSWDQGGNWYNVNANGSVAVSGQNVELSLDCSVFGLPANMNVWGRTMEVSDPYDTYDRFSSSFKETEGQAYLYSDMTPASTPTEWQCSARVSKFSYPGFGDSVPYLHYAGAVLTGSVWDELSPGMQALWGTGDFGGTELDDSLLIMAQVEGYDNVKDVDYEWEWGPETGGGVVIDGLDPSTTTVDLSIEVTNSGQTASFYYRVNSDDAGDWQLGTSHTLPAGTGTLYGVPVNGLCVGLSSGFMRSAPLYRFWSGVSSQHFYTTDRAEKNKLINNYSNVWTYEGIAYYTFAEDGEPNVAPVYRFWSGSLNSHFYTVSEEERDKLINNYSSVWTYEGIAFYAWPDGTQPDTAAPVYRFWSDRLGSHFYTMDEAERDKLINQYSYTWTYEGVAWQAMEQQQD